MTNGDLIVIYLPFSVVFGTLLAVSLINSKGNVRSDRSIFFLACFFIWQVLELLFLFVSGDFAIKYIFALRFIPTFFLPVAFFRFIVKFYRVQRIFPRWVMLGIYIIPALSSLFILIPPLTPLLFTDVTVISTNPITVECGFAFMYYFRLVFEYAVYIATGVIVIIMFRRLPAAYRRGSLFHLIYGGVMIVSQVIYRAAGSDLGFDIFFFSYCVSCLLFYFAHMLNSDSSSFSIDQSSVIDFLDKAVFILNEDRIIVEANNNAVHWLQSLHRNVENVAFDGLLSVLSNNKRILIKKLEDSDDSDIHFVGVGIPLIYRMERRLFTASDGISHGEFVTLTDVSRNRLLIDRLRDMAGVDGLTGTANRYRYQDLLRKLDKSENYPLAVVIGDVNGLKFVNDTFGHHMGDQYIKDIAAVLVDCCPSGGHVARYGGDEFATLLIKTTPESVEDYINDVNRALKIPREDMVHPPSIALGYAIKHHGNENLSALIGQADQKMFEDKQARKKAEREALRNA